MQFHDCIVNGCDASVLLNSTPGNMAEKEAPANNPSLRGFHVIDAAKVAVEASCPCTVSCADIIAFAAREASYLAGHIHYPVQAGRRDGTVSRETDARAQLPSPASNASALAQLFGKKGLSIDDMVTLSGAHSIGRSFCKPFASRLYNFSSAQPQDPSINPSFAAYLKTKCAPDTIDFSNNDPTTILLNNVTPTRLDNQYYKNLLRHRGLFTSDQTLQQSPSTAKLVLQDAKNGEAWAAKFAAAMVKLGSTQVLTKEQGEIREKCWIMNSS